MIALLLSTYRYFRKSFIRKLCETGWNIFVYKIYLILVYKDSFPKIDKRCWQLCINLSVIKSNCLFILIKTKIEREYAYLYIDLHVYPLIKVVNGERRNQLNSPTVDLKSFLSSEHVENRLRKGNWKEKCSTLRFLNSQHEDSLLIYQNGAVRQHKIQVCVMANTLFPSALSHLPLHVSRSCAIMRATLTR